MKIKILLKFSALIFAMSCLCAVAQPNKMMNGNLSKMPPEIQANLKTMNRMSDAMIKMKLTKVGNKMMMMGIKVYSMGKFLMMGHDQDMMMKGKKMVIAGTKIYMTGKMLAGRDLDLTKIKKWMMKKRRY